MTSHSKKIFDLLIFMPVGPKCQYNYLNDNIDSIWHHIDEERAALLLINDSGRRDFRDSVHQTGNTWIYDVPKKEAKGELYNTFGSLFTKQISALREINKEVDWRCALRIDDDALIIGSNPQDDALAKFDSDPKLGLLGAYRYRGDGTSKQKAMSQKGRNLIKQILKVSSLYDLRRSAHLLWVLQKSLRNGYRLGDMCTGGSVFFSKSATDAISSLLSGHELYMASSTLDDDLLFAFYTAAAGLHMGEFSRPDREDEIMAINYRGLPMPLEKLVEQRKKVVHPIKDVNDADFEATVRRFFKAQRDLTPPTSSTASSAWDV